MSDVFTTNQTPLSPSCFALRLEGGVVQGDTLLSGRENKEGVAIFLHGAGGAERGRFSGVRNQLFIQHGIDSVAFDFLGHGQSTGRLQETSLLSRTQQALAVVRFLGLSECSNLSIIATSMSGYTAIKLTIEVRVKSLILLAPAVYTIRAYNKKFGHSFSSIIRETESWRDSDAWHLIEMYRGRLLVISAQNDDVIPSEIPKLIVQHAQRAVFVRHIEMPDASHQILAHINQSICRIEQIAAMIAEMMK